MDVDKFTKDGKFLMLALDHRGSIKKLMDPQNPDSVSDKDVISLKNEIIEALKDQFSGLLIDESWGLEACHEVCQVKPFLLPVEKSGYTDQEGERVTELEYRVTQLVTMGASGVKMLLYFNPNVESAKKQVETAKKVLEECRQAGVPFFLEPVTYLVSGDSHTQDPELVLGSLKMLLGSGVKADVFKLEYPGNLQSCHEITKLLGETHWILLTNPDSYEEFKAHLKEAVQSGCKGFLAGRAIWKEVTSLSEEAKQQFLNTTLSERFKAISDIVEVS